MTDYSDLAQRLRDQSWVISAEEASNAIEAQAKRIAELEAENQKIMDRLRYAEIGNPLICSNLKVQSHDELIAITIDKMQTRIRELQSALKPFAYYAEQIPHDVSDTASASRTVGYLRRARKVLEDK
jgi:hypothetical protein